MEKDPEDDEIWLVPIRAIRRHWNPFIAWETPEISVHDIRAAVAERRFRTESFDTLRGTLDRRAEYHFHVERIAYLIEHPDPTPISIEIGSPGHEPSTGARIQLEDGNHRLAAALYRGDKMIAVTYAGECDRMRVLFPTGKIRT